MSAATSSLQSVTCVMAIWYAAPPCCASAPPLSASAAGTRTSGFASAAPLQVGADGPRSSSPRCVPPLGRASASASPGGAGPPPAAAHAARHPSTSAPRSRSAVAAHSKNGRLCGLAREARAARILPRGAMGRSIRNWHAPAPCEASRWLRSRALQGRNEESQISSSCRSTNETTRRFMQTGVRRRRGERGEGARAAADRGDGETAQGGARTPTASMSAAHRECVCAASATRPRRARVHLALCAVLASLLPGVAGAIDCANYQDAVGATFKHTAARLAPCEGKTQQEPCRCVQAGMQPLRCCALPRASAHDIGTRCRHVPPA